jgi:hypothetical protein
MALVLVAPAYIIKKYFGLFLQGKLHIANDITIYSGLAL